jgi:hypothetical protein
VDLPNHQADRRERDGTAGMEQAEVADFHETLSGLPSAALITASATFGHSE